jgi:hypothetical protein
MSPTIVEPIGGSTVIGGHVIVPPSIPGNRVRIALSTGVPDVSSSNNVSIAVSDGVPDEVLSNAVHIGYVIA